MTRRALPLFTANRTGRSLTAASSPMCCSPRNGWQRSNPPGYPVNGLLFWQRIAMITSVRGFYSFCLFYRMVLTLTVMLLSILASDAIAVPLSPAFPVPELQYVIDHSSPSVLLSTERFADKAREIYSAGLQAEPLLDVRSKISAGSSSTNPVSLTSLHEPQGGLMLYTSGTTNRPVCSKDRQDHEPAVLLIKCRKGCLFHSRR